jgi:hypothetical protein
MEPVTLDQARDALEQHVRTTFWLRRDLARVLAVQSFEGRGAHHLVLESFT